MPLPQLSIEDVANISPRICNISQLASGGQKLVFSCEIDNLPCVIKFLLVEQSARTAGQISHQSLNEVTSRVTREVNTIDQINIPTLVKLGPIKLQSISINDQDLLYYTEEKIDGKDIRSILRERRTLTIDEAKLLGCDIAIAIDSLWKINKIHRDIKPGNIMLRNGTGKFVLLDLGIVFDLGDVSLTQTPFIMGTIGYHSPEQLIYDKRRLLDFRSDIFALGVVLYESVTGLNPFTLNASNKDGVMHNTLNLNPQKPSTINSNIPAELDHIILRMLNKQPHLRYNSCKELVSQFQNF